MWYIYFSAKSLNENFEVVFLVPKKLMEETIKPKVSFALGVGVSGTSAIHRLYGRFWPERNLNVNLEEKFAPTHPPSPLEASVREFGDPNPCCAKLFQP